MTSWLLSVPGCWQQSSSFYIMPRMCPRFMTNDRVFILPSIASRLFSPYFQSVRATPALHVKIKASPESSHAKWTRCSSQALAFMDLSPVMPWHRHMHMLRVLCTTGVQLYCTSCTHSDYISKLKRAGEYSWSWKCDRLYYKTVWTVPGAILACAC